MNDRDYKKYLDEVKHLIPPKQWRKVMAQDRCELDCDFMGFLNIYKPLSDLIPKEYTVIDFGCNLAAQAFFFANYKEYIGVDTCELERFRADNTTHYVKSIQAFMREDFPKLDGDDLQYCAICSYVPDEKATELVRQNFKNVFCFYPANFSRKRR